MNKFLTTKQALKYLGIKRLATLYQYIHSGKLKAYRMGDGNSSKRHWRIAEIDLEKFIKQGANSK